MSFVILTQYNGAILGPIAKLLGWILEWIYRVLALVHIQNTGLCIVIFTFLINALMIPFQIKQQKFTRMSAIMNPELQKIQNKYKGKNDQESQRKMSAETQAVYTKYGVSPASGCLPLLITFPIIFALYRVIYNIPAYVSSVYAIYEPLAENLRSNGITVNYLSKFATAKTYVVNTAVKGAKADPKNIKYFVDVISQYTTANFKDFITNLEKFISDGKFELSQDKLSVLKSLAASTSRKASHANSFIGMNIADTPKLTKITVIIPIVSIITQFISQKLSMTDTNTMQTDKSSAAGATASSMKMMTNIMPFVSGFFCLTFPIGVGIYWIAGNLFRIIQSLFINDYFRRHDVTKEMEKNKDKASKRMKMMGMSDAEIKKSLNTKPPTAEEIKASNEKAKQEKEESKKSVFRKSSLLKISKRDDDDLKDQPEIKSSGQYKKGSISYYAHMNNRNTSVPEKNNKNTTSNKNNSDNKNSDNKKSGSKNNAADNVKNTSSDNKNKTGKDKKDTTAESEIKEKSSK